MHKCCISNIPVQTNENTLYDSVPFFIKAILLKHDKSDLHAFIVLVSYGLLRRNPNENRLTRSK